MKRLFDVVFALIGLILFAPVIIVLSILIKLNSRGSIYYRGARTGKGNKAFRIYKFRTMVANAEAIGGPSTSDGDARITSIGLFMRKFKLDELPQLINVLKGEMSFVGPRPEVKYYTDQYTEIEKAILTVRPGITDWASLANSDEGAILAKYDDPDKAYEEIIRPQKLKLQLKYVRERSFLKDIDIILKTVRTIFERGEKDEMQCDADGVSG